MLAIKINKAAISCMQDLSAKNILNYIMRINDNTN